jgi:membrane protein YqaA with SNARE-associated domain
MNQTTEKLQSGYAVRFLVAAGFIAATAITAHLILLGSRLTNDHFLWAVFIAAVCGVVGWLLFWNLCRRWKDLKQLELLQKHGPYDRREFVAPQEAVSQVGSDGNGPNMWSPS